MENTMSTLAQSTNSQDVAGHELLVFTLGDEEYGIDILKVQEIRGYDTAAVTRIANVPNFIKGVTNLRGIIIPIVDLRIKFNLGRVDYDAQTVVIILNLDHRVVGIVVDGVSDVLMLNPSQIRPAPTYGETLSAQYLTGLGTVDDRMLILVNIERLMSSDEMELVETAVH
jgi:purine-binding chemotaxis protein CheW